MFPQLFFHDEKRRTTVIPDNNLLNKNAEFTETTQV